MSLYGGATNGEAAIIGETATIYSMPNLFFYLYFYFYFLAHVSWLETDVPFLKPCQQIISLSRITQVNCKSQFTCKIVAENDRNQLPKAV